MCIQPFPLFGMALGIPIALSPLFSKLLLQGRQFGMSLLNFPGAPVQQGMGLF